MKEEGVIETHTQRQEKKNRPFTSLKRNSEFTGTLKMRTEKELFSYHCICEWWE